MAKCKGERQKGSPREPQDYGTPDQALARAAEERAIDHASGQRRDDRLVVREKSQYHAGTVYRAGIRESLRDELKRAFDEIEIGHRQFTAFIGMKTPSYDDAGGGGMGAEDVFLQYSKRTRRYIDWRAALEDMPMVRSVCLDVAGEGMTCRECARRYPGLITDKTVRKYLEIGLERYAELNFQANARDSARDRHRFIGEEKV